jgi:hypothetical protein
MHLWRKVGVGLKTILTPRVLAGGQSTRALIAGPARSRVRVSGQRCTSTTQLHVKRFASSVLP